MILFWICDYLRNSIFCLIFKWIRLIYFVAFSTSFVYLTRHFSHICVTVSLVSSHNLMFEKNLFLLMAQCNSSKRILFSVRRGCINRYTLFCTKLGQAKQQPQSNYGLKYLFSLWISDYCPCRLVFEITIVCHFYLRSSYYIMIDFFFLIYFKVNFELAVIVEVI